MKRYCLALTLVGLLSSAFGQKELQVLENWKLDKQRSRTLYSQLSQVAFEQLEARGKKIAGLKTATAWKTRQAEIKAVLMKSIGGFPEKTPLNAVVTGVLEKDGIKVEKLYFESLPGYYVTAALFTPRSFSGKLPAIVYCSGHTASGFRSGVYQNVILNYVKKGFAVLAFDPIGQGERIQYLDADGRSTMGSTHEHSYPGSQVFASGISPARYFIWDGIRAIDYLATRAEIDMARIGITGRSGGGTQSAYIAALDDRVTAAAPECYITTFEMLLRSIGPQDAEQNFLNSIEQGFDIPDLIELRAPKPTMIITTYNDFFSIQGARDVYEEAKPAFEKLGKPNNLSLVTDEAGHASTLLNREAAYAFFQEHLSNKGDSKEAQTTLFDEKELYSTTTGNIYSGMGGKDLRQVHLDNMPQNRMTAEADLNHLTKFVTDIPAGGDSKFVYAGRVTRDKYSIEKYLIETPGGVFLPVLWLKPIGAVKSAVLIVDEKGKQEAAKEGGLADKLAEGGCHVVLADLSGFGELSETGLPGGDANIANVSLNVWYLGLLTRHNLTSYRSQELTQIGSFMKKVLPETPAFSIVGKGALATDVLQHVVLSPDQFKKIVLINPVASYESVIRARHYQTKFLPSLIPGLWPSQDLPDLIKGLPEGKVMVLDVQSADGKILSGFERGAYQKSVGSARVLWDFEDIGILEAWLKH